MMEKLTAEQEATAEDAPLGIPYTIDPGWYEERSLSLGHIVQVRRCSECATTGFKAKKAKGARAKRSTDSAISWVQEMEVIGEHCSSKAGYVTPYTTIMEAVFRLLLQNGNQPLLPQQIYAGIKEWWTGFEHMRDLTLPSLTRMLEYQHSYGIRPVKAEPDAAVSGG